MSVCVLVCLVGWFRQSNMNQAKMVNMIWTDLGLHLYLCSIIGSFATACTATKRVAPYSTAYPDNVQATSNHFRFLITYPFIVRYTSPPSKTISYYTLQIEYCAKNIMDAPDHTRDNNLQAKDMQKRKRAWKPSALPQTHTTLTTIMRITIDFLL